MIGFGYVAMSIAVGLWIIAYHPKDFSGPGPDKYFDAAAALAMGFLWPFALLFFLMYCVGVALGWIALSVSEYVKIQRG